MNNGYIKVWRKMKDTSFYKDSYAVHLATHLLLSANHKNNKMTFNGQEIEVLEGQLITGRNSLSLDSGIKPSNIRNKLLLLKKVGFLDIKSNNKFSLITILKYNEYQKSKNDLGQQIGQQSDNKVTTNGQQSDSKQDTNKKYKNDKNDKNEKKVKVLAGMKPARKVKPENPNPHLKQVITHICTTWEKKKGSKYYFISGKHSKIISLLCKAYSNHEIMALWDLYLISDDDFYKKCGHSIEVFATSMPKLLDQPYKSVAKKYEKDLYPGLQPAGDILKKVGL